MKIALLLLHIVVYDYDTGNMLYNYWERTEATRRDCIKEGVRIALPVVMDIRTKLPNASANVTCHAV